jgi:ribosomal protein RSM22 (predicted rRNA methylase)
MQLPSTLRELANEALRGSGGQTLTRAHERLSARYRAEVHDGRAHVGDEMTALAYVATRMPATYAAISAAFRAVANVRADFIPRTLLDAGAGPGTVLWAAAQAWPSLAEALLIERSAAIARLGGRFSAKAGIARVTWSNDDMVAGLRGTEPRDLVTLAYVLGEIEDRLRDDLIQRLWSLTGDTLIVVEPGTPAGWTRILRMRDFLIAAGAHIIAPCPHAFACPLAPPDWCHFAQRVERSKLHRETKQAESPFEDEKFIYLGASRIAGRQPAGRVIARSQAASGRVNVKLCLADGEARWRLFTRREGDHYRKARRLEWGDAI